MATPEGSAYINLAKATKAMADAHYRINEAIAEHAAEEARRRIQAHAELHALNIANQVG